MRLKERTEGRDKRVSLQAIGAQLKAIRAAGNSTPDDLSAITTPSLSQTATTTSWFRPATPPTWLVACPTPT